MELTTDQPTLTTDRAYALAAEFLAARRAWAGGLDFRMDATDGEPGDGEPGDGDPADGDPADGDLGDAGKQALDRMKAERKQLRADLRAFRDLGLSVDDIKALKQGGKPAGDGKGSDAPDPDEIRRQARAEADRDASTRANDRILRSEVKAAAAGKLADPADAHRFLDLSQFEVDADGNVDQEELDDAIAELLTKRPYLAAAQGPQRRFQGGADQGARKEKAPTLAQQISKAESEGNWTAARALKARQLTELTREL